MKCLVPEKERIEEVIKHIVEDFEWEETLTMLQSVNWVYADAEEITVEVLQNLVLSLIESAINSDAEHPIMLASGGFEIRYQKNKFLSVVFAPFESPFSEDIDEAANLRFINKNIIGRNIEEAENVLHNKDIEYVYWKEGDPWPEAGVLAIVLDEANDIIIKDAWVVPEEEGEE